MSKLCSVKKAKKKKKNSGTVGCYIVSGLFVLISLCCCVVFIVGSTGETTPPGPWIPNGTDAEIMCREFVVANLKSPSTAEFIEDVEEVYSINGKPKYYYLVTGYVDAQNSFGAIIRSRYRCELHYDSEMWHLDYIEIE